MQLPVEHEPLKISGAASPKPQALIIEDAARLPKFSLSWWGNILHFFGYLNSIRNNNFNFNTMPGHRAGSREDCSRQHAHREGIGSSPETRDEAYSLATVPLNPEP